MNATTASPTIDSRKRMILPLSVFFLACFLFAGAIKFHLKGGELWFAKPAGAPVTCSVLAVMGFLAARWFFGTTPNGVPKLILATLVVLLPLTGLLGVIQLATHDPVSSSLDPTPLGGLIGSMLAGPRAFGAFGTTVAGIMFATLALFGGYLARRITTKDDAAGSEDPFVLARAMSARRASAAEEGAVAVAEPEAPAEGGDRAGELFAHDAELEAEAPEAGVSEPLPLGAVEFGTVEPQEEDRAIRFGAVESQEETEEMRFVPSMPMPEVAEVEDVEEAIPEPPRRMSMLAGILDEAPEETEDEPIAPFLISPELFAEPEPMNEAGESLAMNLEEERETRLETAREPDAEPEEEPAPRNRYALRSAFEAVEEPSLPEVENDDASEGEPEIAMAEGGESPDLAPEWIAAPARFHTPRLVREEVRDEVPSGESLFDILDVQQVQAPAPVVEEEPVMEEPPPPPPRPRFRVKAVVQEEAPAELQVDMPMESMVEMRMESMMEPPEEEAAVIAAPVEIETPEEPAAQMEQTVIAPEVEEEDAQERPAYRRRKRRSPKAPEPQPVVEASEPETTAPELQPVFAPSEPEMTAPVAPEAVDVEGKVEAQLDLPSMPEPAAPAAEDAEAESRRPRRRMRSAAKDWATWDEQASKERPRLRLVKGEESTPVEATVEARDEAPAKPEADDSYDRAVALVIAEDRCSVSLLQRNLGVTFGEATALIDRMFQQGVVGPYQPTGRRDVVKRKS